MTYKEQVIAKIQENYGKKTIDLPQCDQVFDFNNDGIINYKDLGIAGRNTEVQNKEIMAKYDVCMAPSPPPPQDNTWLFLIGLGLAAAIILSNKK